MNEYIQLVVNGLCTGFGASLGTYFATRGFIQHIERLEKKINAKT